MTVAGDSRLQIEVVAEGELQSQFMMIRTGGLPERIGRIAVDGHSLAGRGNVAQ